MSAATPHDAPQPFQRISELNEMISTLHSEPPASILEIGVWAGGTIAALGRAFPEAIRVGVDPEVQPSALDQGATLIEGRSQDEAVRRQVEAIRDQFDFVFIDGAHDEDSTMLDLEWAVSLDPTWIAIHDITCRTHSALDCWKVWDKIVEYAPRLGRETYEFKHDPEWWGIGLIRISKESS